MQDLQIKLTEAETFLKEKRNFDLIKNVAFPMLDQKYVVPAVREAVAKGLTVGDFLKKDVYAVPFKTGYALVEAIGRIRKIGAKNGVVGSNEPVFEEKDGQIVSCSVTVKKKIDEYIGEFTAKVYFKEYSSSKHNWQTMPRTMITKVAEMHALRKACPEDLSQSFVEEEFDAQTSPKTVIDEPISDDEAKLEAEVRACKTKIELRAKYKEFGDKGYSKARWGRIFEEVSKSLPDENVVTVD